MAKIFCVANQKGGVGKTTTSVNLAAGLAKLDQRVLLVDLDPQGNATMGAGINKASLEGSIYQVLLGELDVPTARLRSESGRFDVLPANRELAGAEVEMVALENRERRLKEALAAVDKDYDFILVDCPPALSLLTLNGLCAAHGVIIPMQCEYYALEGSGLQAADQGAVRAPGPPLLRLGAPVGRWRDRPGRHPYRAGPGPLGRAECADRGNEIRRIPDVKGT